MVYGNYDKRRDADSLRITSMVATEWARNRAFEIAKSDAFEAARIHRQQNNDNHRHHHHLLSPMVVCDDDDGDLMDIDDCGDCGDGNDRSDNIDSDLSYWANSSWTKRLMGEGIF